MAIRIFWGNGVGRLSTAENWDAVWVSAGVELVFFLVLLNVKIRELISFLIERLEELYLGLQSSLCHPKIKRVLKSWERSQSFSGMGRIM